MTTFIEGLLLVLQWPTIGFLILGVALGVWLGAVPGLSGIIGIVIALPFTFGMDPVPALALLLAIYAVTSTGDTLSAILLGVPGTASAAATVIDGYPLAKQGQAERALGAAFTVSMMGGVAGGLILALSLPVIRPVIVQFASPEFFMLGVLGLTMVGALSGASILKGLTAACLGLLASMVGYAPASPVPRYWFDQVWLLEGLPLIAVVLGLFALPEIMDLALRNRAISHVPKNQSEGGGLLRGMRDAIEHRWLVLRCSAIGIYIGMLPGLGAAIVDWVAYGHTVQSAKGETRFGQGDIRGVIGPESANNAVRGGALIPTVAFGIPGSASMAVLLGALLIQGIRPGQDMLVDKLDITYSMIWTIILANILAAVILLSASRQIARIAFVPGHYIVPVVVALVLMGCWLDLAHLGVWGVMIVFAVLGVWMKHAGWPRPPLLLGFILGPIMESGFRLSTRAYGEFAWLTRPFVLIFMAVIVLTIVLKLRGQVIERRRRRRPHAAAREMPTSGEGHGGDPFLSLLLAGFLVIVFAGAALMSLDWRPNARLFPLSVSIFALPLLGLMVAQGLVPKLRKDPVMRLSGQAAPLAGSAAFLLAILGVLATAWAIGQPLALALFASLYLLVYARTGIVVGLTYGVLLYGFLVLFYGHLLNIAWLQPALPVPQF